MEGDLKLAENNEMGCVWRCSHGMVHVHCGRVSLHLPEDAFMSFASMVKEASSRLMDEWLSYLSPKKKELGG